MYNFQRPHFGEIVRTLDYSILTRRIFRIAPSSSRLRKRNKIIHTFAEWHALETDPFLSVGVKSSYDSPPETSKATHPIYLLKRGEKETISSAASAIAKQLRAVALNEIESTTFFQSKR
ncbi:hypothetical protein TNCV_3221471 [Trichonephila clavipes]|nr:hypothetical protein TNCV_3221471 [Trichonephila clavipes]